LGDKLTRRGFVTMATAFIGGIVSTGAAARPHRHSHLVKSAKHNAHRTASASLRAPSQLPTRIPARPNFPVRIASFHNLHTNERLSITYWRDGAYVPVAMTAINRVLRDHISGEIYPMDPRLIDLLDDLRRALGTSTPFQIISGYRSPSTNAWLQQTHPGVAAHSLHMNGQAADVSLTTCSLDSLHNAALALQEGGVGFYPRSDFVHVDTGPVREWTYG
jgi:uncharacterized protein YcbK (DUF882 family)